MSVYFQWSLYGIDLCLQTQGPVDSCSRVITLFRSKNEESTKQLHACGRRHMVPLVAPLMETLSHFLPLNAPLPASSCISPGAECHLSLQTPPSWPLITLSFGE